MMFPIVVKENCSFSELFKSSIAQILLITFNQYISSGCQNTQANDKLQSSKKIFRFKLIKAIIKLIKV